MDQVVGPVEVDVDAARRSARLLCDEASAREPFSAP
jgi:hypothetical protein